MATIIFSAAGAAIGGSVGGTLAGLSSVAIGRAVGATLGRIVDQRLLGQGGEAVETGKVERFRLTNAGEGDAITQLYGRMRLGGQVIWASDFEEVATTTGGGKGGPPEPETTAYSYMVSLAVALCEGEITHVGRIWADGEEIAPDDLNMRVYPGRLNQLPDPHMEAIEGAGMVPAYRGTAYVVMENLALQQFGNRVPQFTFEVIRPAQRTEPGGSHALSYGVEAVALIPGTGEYALATTPVNYLGEEEARWSANISTPAGKTDFALAVETLQDELPNLSAASLIVSWFGDDLRCGTCEIRPKVEDEVNEGENMPWQVAGLTRSTADVIAREEGRPIYGGTPTDASVREAIAAMNAAGKAVMFYPFILMDQMAGNDLPNPYGEGTQPALPWRGRITLGTAPGIDGSPDGTAAAADEVNAFFGAARAADFTVADGAVSYSGPDEWRFARFILHYAALAKAAGGVDAFCIGSEMRGLTQIRSAQNVFPAVERLRALAADVRAILGPETKISYAADWSEYFGYQPQDGSGDLFFHLDPLWADANIDFVGIDNYMPLSDWRDGETHLDRQDHGAIYDLDYLQSNIEGGEGYAWYYASPEHQAAQRRTPIVDAAHGEDWVFRYKDIRSWWSNFHNERIGGTRIGTPTAWIPGSKPIWFTEYGCAAIDKGTNQPNKFLDPKSSESSLPHYSNGGRDDLIQMQYLRAMIDYWSKPENNPDGFEYDGPMIDMSRAFVWAWDVRPYPQFPNNAEQWSDGQSYGRGHWLNGRTSARTLASVVGEICRRAGVEAFDTDGLHGIVRGYAVEQITDARASLQPLMLRYGFDAIERDGILTFRMRDGLRETALQLDEFAISDELDGATVQTREGQAEVSGRIRLRFVQADANFDVIAEEAVLPDEETHSVSASEFNLALTRAEGRQIAERWLTEARVASEHIKFALPPSQMALGAGDVVELPQEGGEGRALYRIDRVDQGMFQQIEAVRIEPEVYLSAPLEEELTSMRPFVPPVPVYPLFLDLPLLEGSEAPHAPHIAVTAKPWPGSVALYAGQTDANYQLNTLLPTRCVMGRTLNALPAAQPGLIDHGDALEVKLISGQLESVQHQALLSGSNLAAIGDGSSGLWEVFQFEEAELLSPGVYLLRKRLRGQAGSDGLMPDVWPAGSKFVLLNGAPKQIEMPRNLRRVSRHYRIGPAQRGASDASFRHLERAFDGNGLRPYAPCHLNADLQNGDLAVSWIRRTRIDGDDWSGSEVPLGEETESYHLRVINAGAVVREETVTSPDWVYDATARTADGATGAISIEVAQVSSVFGPGPYARLEVAV